MPFFRSVAEVSSEKQLARLFPRLPSGGRTSAAADLDLYCGGDDVREE